MRVAEDLVRKIENRPGNFIVVQMREKLISSKLGFVAVCSAIQALIVIQLNERYESCDYRLVPSRKAAMGTTNSCSAVRSPVSETAHLLAFPSRVLREYETWRSAHDTLCFP